MRIPYLKKNAKQGLVEETVEYAHCDLIVYRILLFWPMYITVVSLFSIFTSVHC